MDKVMVAPSMMCSDYANLEREIRVLEKVGVDYLHIDVMDGHFVPNMTIGPDYVKCIRGLTGIPLDIHLMTETPELFIPMFGIKKGDKMCFHVEATKHPHKHIVKIKESGAQAGIAVNPGTPLEAIEELLATLDFVHILSVNPGFAGQPLIPGMLDKIKRLRKQLGDKNLERIDIEVDGSVQFENMADIVKSGANCLVLGPFTCFHKELGIEKALLRTKEILDRL